MRTRSDVAIGFALVLTGTVSAHELPPVDSHYDSQLGGAYAPAPGVGVVSRDRQAPPATGLYSICYVNAFQSQPDAEDWWLANHPDLLLRRGDRLVEDTNWPGEYLLDITTADKRAALAEIVGAWIDQCARDGFQAVEADNLDSWSRSHHMIAMDHAIAYSALLAGRAHGAGLAIGQKNAKELGPLGLAAGFDFAITENCALYDECGDYTAIFGARVFQIEYDRAVFDRACAERGTTDIIVLRDLLLTPAGESGHVFETC